MGLGGLRDGLGQVVAFQERSALRIACSRFSCNASGRALLSGALLGSKGGSGGRTEKVVATSV